MISSCSALEMSDTETFATYKLTACRQHHPSAQKTIKPQGLTYMVIGHKHTLHPFWCLKCPFTSALHSCLASLSYPDTSRSPRALSPYAGVRDSQWGDSLLPSQSLWYQMDRGIGPDRVLRKAAQQVCGTLAGSPGEALLR